MKGGGPSEGEKLRPESEGWVLTSVFETLFGAHINVTWQKGSRCAEIYGVHYAGKNWVIKIPGMGSVVPAEMQVLGTHMREATEEFLRRLQGLHVPLPEPYNIADVQGFPVHLMPDEGEDCAEIIKKYPGRADEIAGKILTAIAGVLVHGNREVGLDVRLSNFALPNGEVRCIDIFPPLLWFRGEYLVHYPNPTGSEEIRIEVERKFTPFGILRRFRFDLIAIDSELEPAFLRQLPGLDRSIRDEVADRFAALPDRQIHRLSRSERIALLNRLDPWDADSRREIAARLIPVDEHRHARMQAVFAATSFVGFTDEDRARRLVTFREILDPYL